MTHLSEAVNSKDHKHGNPDAILTLVEYGDYECPYCGRAYPIVKGIQEELKNDLQFVFRNFPLSKIHPNAKNAALATEAAAEQGKFWEMHDIIFENQKTLDPNSILFFAREIGLDVDRFEKDMQRDDLIHKVNNDFQTGLRSGVNRTPSFFINGVKFEGMYSGDQLLHFLKNQLNTVPQR